RSNVTVRRLASIFTTRRSPADSPSNRISVRPPILTMTTLLVSLTIPLTLIPAVGEGGPGADGTGAPGIGGGGSGVLGSGNGGGGSGLAGGVWGGRGGGAG